MFSFLATHLGVVFPSSHPTLITSSSRTLCHHQNLLPSPQDFHLTHVVVSFTPFYPLQPLHSAPFAPSLVIRHCVLILNTCIDSVVTPGNLFLLIQKFISLLSPLWMSKGAHPNLRELFLRPTSIRSTFTSLRQPNLHSFRLLPRPVMPLLPFTFI